MPRDDRPYVPIVFFAFRIMVGIGIVLLITAITGAVLRWRGTLYETRWFQFLAMAVTPLGFLAVLAGWTTTEAGRQPFVIYGHLRTADAVAPVSAGAVTTTLLIFFVVYNVLLIAFLLVCRAHRPQRTLRRFERRPGDGEAGTGPIRPHAGRGESRRAGLPGLTPAPGE